MKIFIGVAWPYVNGDLHLGHLAGALLPADIFARYQRLMGHDVLMVSGSDAHGTPTVVIAEKEGISPKDVVKKFHPRHLENLDKMGMSFNLYTSTATQNHKEVVQELFRDLAKKGFLIKKKSKQYWSEKEKKFLLDRFIEGECPHCHYKSARGDQCDNCGRTLEPLELINPHSRSGDAELTLKENEDFYLDLPSFQEEIEKWLKAHPNRKKWRSTVLSFTNAWLKEGLKARPITRNLDYGIPLPEGIEIADKLHKVIYVWFEAVTGYWSAAVEWSKRVSGEMGRVENVRFLKLSGQSTSWRDFWLNKSCKHYYFMGKDNVVFHTIIWPTMLMGWNKDRKEQMQLAWDVPANAFLNLEGDKMSKSRNWFVELEYLLDTYGQDLVRFYFTVRMPEKKDSDFKWKDFVDVNNNELVANLGNFVHRTLSFISSKFEGVISEGILENEVRYEIRDAFSDTGKLLEEVKLSEALSRVMKLADFGNKYFDSQAVWNVVKKDKKKAGEILFNCAHIISALGTLLIPFLPNAAYKIHNMLGQKEPSLAVGRKCWRFSNVAPGTKLKDVETLFKKLELEVADMERAKLG